MGVSTAPVDQARLERLRRLLEGTSDSSPDLAVVPTHWPAFDTHLAERWRAEGLVLGCLHEWIGVEGSAWRPPLSLFVHLARRALEDRLERDREGAVLWIGRRVWPYPAALATPPRIDEVGRESSGSSFSIELEASARERSRALFTRSFLIDPPDEGSRLWSIDAALRSSPVAAVVADGSRLSIASTRRLQLAAREGDALALLARPPEDLRALSAATTRFHVLAGVGDRWWVQLLRAKPVFRGE